MMRPTLTLGLLNFDPAPALPSLDRWIEEARRAEAAGIDRLVVVDHVVMGNQLDAYDGGTFPTGPDGSWVEPMTLLSVIAGATTTIRLSTGILIAGLRPAALLAKSAATLDVASNGRLELGVGVGWQKEEYDAEGLDFAKRGQILDDTLGACEVLWGDSPATYSSPTISFGPTWCHPTPLQTGGVPFWIAGRISSKTVARMVRFGSGWIPWGEYQRDVVKGIEQLRKPFEEAGRDLAEFGIRGNLVVRFDGKSRLDSTATFEPIRALLEAGVNDFGLMGKIPNDAAEREQVLREVVAGFDVVTGRAPR
jgi:probable F420-dependent oxidoreductase